MSDTSSHFWITNISKKAVSLRDLNLSIQPLTSINLLDGRHYSFTEEQLIVSAQSGSLFKKSHMVIVRILPPGEKAPNYIPVKEDAIFSTRQRSTVEIENIKYEELEISDDKYANDNAELAEIDRQK